MNRIRKFGKIYLYIKAILLIIILTSCSYRAHSSGNMEISLDLHHSHADKVYLVYFHQGEFFEKLMTRISQREFIITAEFPDGEYLFNLRSESDLYPGIADWIGKPSGIDASSMVLNGVSITPDYLVKQEGLPPAAFSLTVVDDNVFRGGGMYWDPDERIPPELPQYHHYCRYRIPPTGFSAALPWMHSLHTGGEDSSSTIEVDYLRLYAVTAEGRVLLHSDDYSIDSGISGYDHGGTYNRYPFFFNEETDNWPMPAEKRDGSLIIKTDTHRDRSFHWWSTARTEIPEGSQYLIIETRVRISGEAVVQIGLDFWIDLIEPYAGLDINNTEAGVGNVIFPLEQPVWQEVSYSTESLIPWAF